VRRSFTTAAASSATVFGAAGAAAATDGMASGTPEVGAVLHAAKAKAAIAAERAKLLGLM
jgi:hypothetical protein